MTDPHDALVAFQQGLDNGEIPRQPAKTDPDISTCIDRPNGNTRITYLLMRDGIIHAIALIVHEGSHRGLPCFGIGYAVHEKHRREGLGKKIASAAMEEFRSGMASAGISSYYIEAVVGVDNAASKRIAGQLISTSSEAITDSVSGLPALHYSKLMK